MKWWMLRLVLWIVVLTTISWYYPMWFLVMLIVAWWIFIWKMVHFKIKEKRLGREIDEIYSQMVQLDEERYQLLKKIVEGWVYRLNEEELEKWK